MSCRIFHASVWFARSCTGGYTILCHFVHINSLLQLHEQLNRSTFFSTSALLCISALLRAFMTNYLNYPFFLFWCNQYSGSCFWNYAMMNTPIFRHRETFFLVACMLSLARSSSSTTTAAATPFLFPFILSTTPRGRAGARGSSSAVISRARQKTARAYVSEPVRLAFYEKKKKTAKDLLTIIQCTTGSIKCIVSRLN